MFWVDLLNNIFPVISIVAILAVLAAAAAHYLILGPRSPELAGQKRDVRRFSRLEIVIHAVTLLSFITLAVTGFTATIFLGVVLTGWLRLAHILAAVLFALGLAAITLRWAEDCRFQLCDWIWAKKCGGYLSGDQDVPADRFNGGQKAFFWATAVLSILIMLSGLAMMFPFLGMQMHQVFQLVHRYCSLFAAIFVIVHIYLGTLANPGTWQVILSGYVSLHWAKHHHPLWWNRLDKS